MSTIAAIVSCLRVYKDFHEAGWHHFQSFSIQVRPDSGGVATMRMYKLELPLPRVVDTVGSLRRTESPSDSGRKRRGRPQRLTEYLMGPVASLISMLSG